MKKLAFVVLVGILLLAIVPSCAATTSRGSAAITDDLERTITIEKVPQRIVSLAPNITEMLFALGLGDKVVGVTEACDYPEEALSKPKVGGYFATSLETIINQDPDIVLSDGHDPVSAQLENLGTTMVVIQSETIDGILNDIELLGQIMGKEAAAKKLVAEMQRRIAAVTAKVAGAEKPTVFYVIDASEVARPWSAGAGSFIDAIIDLSGGKNIASSEGAYSQFSLEALLNADPYMIIVDASHGTTSIPDFGSLPGWKEMSAVKSGRVYAIDGNLTSRPGPRIVDGLEAMSKLIHPELFP